MNYTVRMNAAQFPTVADAEDALHKLAVVHANKLGKLITDMKPDRIKDPFNNEIHVILKVWLTN